MQPRFPHLGLWLITLSLLVPPAFLEWKLAWFVGPLVYAAYAVFGGLVLYAWSERYAQARAGCAVFLLGLAVLFVVPWTSRKAFLQQFAKVEQGMSVAQVKEILKAYRAKEVHPSANVTQLGYQHDRSSARFDADGALVQFENGRVVLKEFLPD